MSQHETTATGVKTHAVADVAVMLAGDSMRDPQRWVMRQIRSGRFGAIKVGRSWRMTDEQLQAAVQALASEATAEVTAIPCGQPSAGSLRRRRIA